MVDEEVGALVNGLPTIVVALDDALVVKGAGVVVVCRVMNGDAVEALNRGLTVVVAAFVGLDSSKL